MIMNSNVQPQMYQSPPSGNMDLDQIDKLLSFRLLKLEYIESKLNNLKTNPNGNEIIANKVEHDEKNDNEISIIN